MKNTTLSLVLALAISSLAPAKAYCADLTAENILNIISSITARAELKNRDAGDPYIDIKNDGLSWRIYLINCTHNLECQSMTMIASFKKSQRIGIAEINRWNEFNAYGRAFIDREGYPTLAQDLQLSNANSLYAEASLKQWMSNLSRFKLLFK